MMTLAPTLPPLGSKMVLVALTSRGRLYFDTWRAHEGKHPYTLTGWGRDIYHTRAEAAVILRGVPQDRRIERPWSGLAQDRIGGR